MAKVKTDKSNIKKVIIIFSILTILWSIIVTVILPLRIFIEIKTYGGAYFREGRVIIERINPQSPAAFSTLKPEDVIVSVNGVKINEAKEFATIANQNKGKSLNIIVDSKGVTKSVKLVAREIFPSEEGPTGLVLTDYEFKRGSPFILTYKILIQHSRWLMGMLFLYIAPIPIVIGLMKFKKWALYAYIILRGFFMVYGIFSLLRSGSLFALQNNIKFYLSFTFGIIIILLLYSQRRLFR